MNSMISPAALAAATSAHASFSLYDHAAEPLLAAAVRGEAISTETLRTAMVSAFGGTDAEGAWDWKTAYDVCEIVQVQFLRKFGSAVRARSASPAAALAMYARIASLFPSHTRRSEESQALQQFSTPMPLAFVAAAAAAMTPADVVLEPSAGTGLLAIHAELAGARLVLNELADNRAAILRGLLADAPVTQHDAAHIHDFLDPSIAPSIVLMNPPFSAAAHVETRVADAAMRHIASALARLGDGGRLVAITGAGLAPDSLVWRDAFTRLQEHGRVVFSAAVDGRVYAKHGTTTDTRITVIDKRPAEDASHFPASRGMASDAATLLNWIAEVPPRQSIPTSRVISSVVPRVAARRSTARVAPAQTATTISGVELAYKIVDHSPADRGHLNDAIYETYSLQSISIPGAQPHPTKLVQSAAMASVAPPKPTYRPLLPPQVLQGGLLSDAQLESLIYAGDAHSDTLSGAWTVDDTYDVVSAAPDDTEASVRFRRGWMLGDGTGAGKGRQVAGVLLDNWCHGRTRAVWISKSDKLIEDAQRDWSALGQERLLVTPLSRFRQGSAIRLAQGILFTTYATLRSDAKEDKASRVQQIVDWLGRDFDGVIVFDESHAMANAAGATSERGDSAPSQQGRAGLRLQHALPNARILYVSATGATTVHNLAYAQRLGLWGGTDFRSRRARSL
jgi:predicted RNA methylase